MSETSRLLFSSACNVIERALVDGKGNFILYPFGYAGVEIKRIMVERYGVKSENIVVVDNHLAVINPSVKTIDDIKESSINCYTAFIITVESPLTMKVLFSEGSIPSFIKESDIYYLYPNNVNNDIVYNGCRVGRGTYGYMYLLRRGMYAKSIGRYCSINENAEIVENHELDKFSTYPFHKRNRSNGKELVTIGNDVWIGANVIITMGENIGDGAIIGAGTVVTHDVMPYTIVGGIPAHEIRKRFSDEEIESLVEMRWWNWDYERILSYKLRKKYEQD